MSHPVRRARRRGLVCALAVSLCLGPFWATTRAQEAGPAIASGGEAVLLRELPGYDAVVLTTLGDGSPLEIAGGEEYAADGSAWLPVVVAGQYGYIPAGYVASAPAAPDALAAEAPVAAPDPALVQPEAEMTAAPVDAGVAAGAAAMTTTDANLRAAPSGEAEIMQVLPPGTPLSIDGAAENGFVPVSGNTGSGWIAAELLAAQTAAPLPSPVADATAPTGDAATLTNTLPAPLVAGEADAANAPALETTDVPGKVDRESTGIIWPFAGGEWQVVQGYNNGTHTNRGGFAQYKYSLDWARVDGGTAGQPVYAPVSGTIQWTDRGSGGILIDAGNGYGVALFHVTLDRGISRSGSVERGQVIGTISGPGGDGFMSMEHVEIACWRLLDGGGHESVPFVGANAIAGQEFPDDGGANQHMGKIVAP
jgi:murein DD-endopeptidase MepM/ murein hydrolase activator NlpD